jgi:hypothetical protein
MVTIVGVLVRTQATPGLMQELLPIGVVAASVLPGGAALFVEIEGKSRTLAEQLARKVSGALDGVEVLAMHGKTKAGVFCVAEFAREREVRRIAFSRASGGWTDGAEVATRSWETDFHFATPMDDFLERLAEKGAAQPELDAVREAYDARDLRLLPALPEPSGTSVRAFMQRLGVDVRARPQAHYRDGDWLDRGIGR